MCSSHFFSVISNHSSGNHTLICTRRVCDMKRSAWTATTACSHRKLRLSALRKKSSPLPSDTRHMTSTSHSPSQWGVYISLPPSKGPVECHTSIACRVRSSRFIKNTSCAAGTKRMSYACRTSFTVSSGYLLLLEGDNIALPLITRTRSKLCAPKIDYIISQVKCLAFIRHLSWHI